MSTGRKWLNALLVVAIVLWSYGLSPLGPDSAAAVQLDASTLTKFLDPLPIPAVIQPLPGSPPRIPSYEVRMTQFLQQLHSELPPSTVWGYNGTYPGPTFEVQTNRAIRVKWINNLPDTHLLPVDFTLMGAVDVAAVRTVVHLHGGHVPPESDGYPEHWFTNNPLALPNGLGGPAGNFDTYFYPNRQQATTLWYHDHALSITRLNVYAGLAGFYLIRDAQERALNLPRGPYEIPLVIQDRSFNDDGSLFYPADGQGDPETPPVWVPEVFGDAILVNGKVWPFLEVEPRKYRFRFLNGSNARFYNMTLSSGQPFNQIGTDGGLLPAPAPVAQLLMAPGERADVIIDFSGHAGETIIITNDAPTPFPDGGDDAFDPNFNPNVAVIMQFRVTKPLAGPDTSSLPAALRRVPRIPVVSAKNVRDLTLNEEASALDSPIMSMIGTVADGPLHFDAPITERPHLGTAEIWQFNNLTGDTHPIHVHLVQFQILNRQALLTDELGNPVPVADPEAPAVPPALNEAGWKDTVQAVPGMVTRVIMRFKSFTGRYVLHCHILEHEDNDMMRPFEVLP